MQVQITKNQNYIQDSSLLILADSVAALADTRLNADQKAYIAEAHEAHGQRSFHFNLLSYQLWVELPKRKDNSLHYREALRVRAAALQAQIDALAVEALYIDSTTLDAEEALAFAEGMALSAYRFDELKTDAETSPLKELRLLSAGLTEAAVAEMNIAVEATLMARRWVNLPPNYLDAETFARYMKEAADRVGIHTEVLNKKQIEALKMGGLLAVNQGSPAPPTFTVMTYKPKDCVNSQPIVLVGKGVVYDTGGLNIKPGSYMNDMKSDMGGAAAVAAAIYAVAKAQWPIHLVCIVPATDNRPGQNAYASGDVIRMYDGQTVEVINTDAEGRMLLADALAYAKKYEPQLVIDAATLTGAAARAVGKWAVAAMQVKADRALEKLHAAGELCSERLVSFPMWEEYGEDIKSEVADMKHLGGAEAGQITAAKFLERFTDYPYVHLDIAGPAFTNAKLNYRGHGGTGVGVRLLMQFFKAMLSD